MKRSGLLQPTVRRLGLRVEIQHGVCVDYPVVTVLVDGDELGDDVRRGYHGFDPGEMLGPNTPLLPRGHARRVAILCCNCGTAGCGVVAPRVVERIDGFIEWTDFRRYTGIFDGPTIDGGPLPLRARGNTLLSVSADSSGDAWTVGFTGQGAGTITLHWTGAAG